MKVTNENETKMITLKLNRYYGTPNITKSKLTIEDGEGNALMRCEAREAQFVDYERTQKVPGSTCFCLGTGEYRLRADHCTGNAICLKIFGDARRRGFYIMVGSDEREQVLPMKLQLGRGTSSEPRYRRIADFAKVKEEFQKVLYDNYLEEFRMVVSNEGIVYEKE